MDWGGYAGWTGYADEGRQAGRMDGQEQMGWQMEADGQTDCPKVKTSQLTHQLTWPLEIQCVRPWVSIKT